MKEIAKEVDEKSRPKGSRHQGVNKKIGADVD